MDNWINKMEEKEMMVDDTLANVIFSFLHFLGNLQLLHGCLLLSIEEGFIPKSIDLPYLSVIQ
jgi:hypothetical protein